jgi:hypothetical protein
MNLSFLALLSLCATLLLTPLSAQQPQKSARERLYGAWKLVRIESVGPKGELYSPWLGGGAMGQIIYDRSGQMAVQLVRNPPSKDDKDARDAYEGYYAYFGTFEVNEATGIVTHHIRSSLRPEERGIDYKRSIRFVGDQIMLTTVARPQSDLNGIMAAHRLTFERIRGLN